MATQNAQKTWLVCYTVTGLPVGLVTDAVYLSREVARDAADAHSKTINRRCIAVRVTDAQWFGLID